MTPLLARPRACDWPARKGRPFFMQIFRTPLIVSLGLPAEFLSMTDLADRKCKPCEGGVEPLAVDTVRTLMKSLDAAWTLSDDGRSISRESRFPGYGRTMAFVNAIAWIATVEGHHPDLRVGYSTCVVVYTTHAIGGLSDNDFICAAKVDRLLAGV